MCAKTGLKVGDPVAEMAYGAFCEWGVVRAKHALPVPVLAPEVVALLTSGLTASIGACRAEALHPPPHTSLDTRGARRRGCLPALQAHPRSSTVQDAGHGCYPSQTCLDAGWASLIADGLMSPALVREGVVMSL